VPKVALRATAAVALAVAGLALSAAFADDGGSAPSRGQSDVPAQARRAEGDPGSAAFVDCVTAMSSARGDDEQGDDANEVDEDENEPTGDKADDDDGARPNATPSQRGAGAPGRVCRQQNQPGSAAFVACVRAAAKARGHRRSHSAAAKRAGKSKTKPAKHARP
jgi:hypothetical protein